MKKEKEIGLDFEVDKLTNSIENIVTGDSFATDISSIVTNYDLKEITDQSHIAGNNYLSGTIKSAQYGLQRISKTDIT